MNSKRKGNFFADMHILSTALNGVGTVIPYSQLEDQDQVLYPSVQEKKDINSAFAEDDCSQLQKVWSFKRRRVLMEVISNAN